MWSRNVGRCFAILMVAIMIAAGGFPSAADEGVPAQETLVLKFDHAQELPAPCSPLAPSQHYNVAVSAGWNLISFPVVAYGSPEKVLDDAGGDTMWNVVKWYDPLDSADPWKTYRMGGTANDLNYIDATMGLWVHITDPGSDGELVVDGENIGTVQISLRTGWNLVGYPSLAPAAAATSLPAAVDIVSYYQPAPPYITDTADLASVTLESGNGYWVHSTSDAIWEIANPEPIRQTAEFERMQGVLIRYPLGIPYNLIAEMSEDAIVYTVLRSTYLTQAQNNYASNGVNMANCQWITATTDSYWTRDYGPWWITDEDAGFNIVDFPYNRPARTNDDAFPIAAASYFGVPLDYMNVYHTGGNYMTDGMGISVSTDLVIEENTGLTEAEIRQYHKDYLNIDTYHIVPDVNGDYIKHIDCWAKYLDVDKIMIREVPTGHSQYAEIEAAVDYFESQISAYGTPYQVFRVYTPNNEPYSNCLILNNKVLLPIVGGANDAAAIASYQAAMPGYEVIGFTGTWESTDALHCRTRGIPDQGMLHIRHIPVSGTIPANEPTEIRAKITAHSGSAITGHVLYWKLTTEPTYHEVPMSHVISGYYNATIPGQASGATIQYYISASDASGRAETSPIIGSPDPHVFTVG